MPCCYSQAKMVGRDKQLQHVAKRHGNNRENAATYHHLEPTLLAPRGTNFPHSSDQLGPLLLGGYHCVC